MQENHGGLGYILLLQNPKAIWNAEPGNGEVTIKS